MEFRDINIGDHTYVQVDARDYPFLMEWDWYFDEDLNQAYRFQEENRVYMYPEMVRKHVMKGDSFPVLTELALTSLFCNQDMWCENVEKAEAMRLSASTEGLIVPCFMEWLGSALTLALSTYYDWHSRGFSLLWVNSIKQFNPVRPAKKYETLGAWMTDEYTGAQNISDRGEVVAERAEEAIAEMIEASWMGIVADYNEDHDFEEILESYIEEVYDLTNRIVKTLHGYKIPYLP